MVFKPPKSSIARNKSVIKLTYSMDEFISEEMACLFTLCLDLNYKDSKAGVTGWIEPEIVCHVVGIRVGGTRAKIFTFWLLPLL